MFGELPEKARPMLQEFYGTEVVIDIVSHYVLVGVLTSHDDEYLVLEKADVHDLRDTTTTREQYVVDTRLHGVRSNRHRVLVRRDEIVCLSRLADVIV